MVTAPRVMKKNYILFIIAGILAVIALFFYGFGNKNSNVPLQDGTSQQIDKQEELEETEPTVPIDNETTPIPTATPKPLPTATPTPVPTATPTAMPTPDYGNTGDDSSYGNTVSDNLSNVNSACRIFVGDERLQTLSSYSYDDTDMWLCRSSSDADWFLETACPSITERVVEGSTVIISLGLSDLARAEDYAAIINTYAQTWKDKGCKVYFVSLGPVDSTSYTSNEDIMAFNTVIYNDTSCGFIDVYNYLASNGFTTTDGVNYDGVTSQSIYDYIVNNIQ